MKPDAERSAERVSGRSSSVPSTLTKTRAERKSWDISTCVRLKNPILGFAGIRYAGLFGEYTNNVATSNGKTGYLTGLTFGDEKVVEKGQWYFRGNWRRLEKNAVPDILPDSDFYFGDTGVSGYELVFRYGLWKNINLQTKYVRGEQLSGHPPAGEGARRADEGVQRLNE